MSNEFPIRLMLVDDQGLFLEGLQLLLAREESVSVVALAATGEEAVALYDPAKIDVVLMAMALPGMNGVTAVTRILDANPQARIVMLSRHEEKKYVEAALAAGASGYLMKRFATVHDVVTAIRAAMKGGIFISPEVCRSLFRDAKGQGEIADLLTERQVEVLRLLAQGRAVKQVAAELNLSIKTVETHRSQIMARLGLRTMASLMLYAVRHGIVSAMEDEVPTDLHVEPRTGRPAPAKSRILRFPERSRPI